MKCTVIPGVGFVCGPRAPRKRCRTPGCGEWSTSLCDYPVTRRGHKATCDAPMCDRCRVRQGPDRDYCRPHAEASGQVVKADGPVRGERRIHVATGRDLYVVSVHDHGGENQVTFSTVRPDSYGRCGGVRQTVPLSKWVEKTRAP